jgi:hypothetical protein
MGISTGRIAYLFLLVSCGGAPEVRAPIDMGAASGPAPGANADARDPRGSIVNALPELNAAMDDALSGREKPAERQAAPDAPVLIANALPELNGAMRRALEGREDAGGLQAAPGTDTPTIQGPHATAVVGTVLVSRGAVADAATVAAGMAAGFRRCIQKGLNADPNSIKHGATIQLVAEIGAKGQVLSVSHGSTGAGFTWDVLACVLERVSTASFAPPDGGTSATVVIPLWVEVVAR